MVIYDKVFFFYYAEWLAIIIIFWLCCRFRNVGNCCYANAVLRAFFSLEKVCLELDAGLPTVAAHEQPPYPVIEFFKQLLLKSGTNMEGKLVDVIHGYVYFFCSVFFSQFFLCKFIFSFIIIGWLAN
jgi:hypothetical protein